MFHFTLSNLRNQNHSILFALAVSFAAVQLGLTAYLIVVGSRMRGLSYRSLPFMFLLDALCTVLYPSTCVLWITKGSLDLLANWSASIFWIFATGIVWGSALGFTHRMRARRSCRGIPSDLHCPHYLSPGSLAWMEFVLCVVTLALATIWVRTSRTGRRKGSRFYV